MTGTQLPKTSWLTRHACRLSLMLALAGTAGPHLGCGALERVTPNDGEDGKDGTAGERGATGATGEQGEPGERGTDGTNGEPGEPGTVGPQGPAGESCSLIEDVDAVYVQCGDSVVKLADRKDPEPVYVGNYCSRVVIRIGDVHYVAYSGLVRLTGKWYKVSNTCSVRVVDGEVLTK